MLGMMFGLPVPDDNKLMALALSWVRFQQEYPQTKISRRVSVVIDLAAASSAAYLPMIVAMAGKAREAANTRKRPGFSIPPVNPADKAHREGMNGATPSVSRPGPTGDEMVILSGTPSSGKIDFGS